MELYGALRRGEYGLHMRADALSSRTTGQAISQLQHRIASAAMVRARVRSELEIGDFCITCGFDEGTRLSYKIAGLSWIGFWHHMSLLAF